MLLLYVELPSLKPKGICGTNAVVAREELGNCLDEDVYLGLKPKKLVRGRMVIVTT